MFLLMASDDRRKLLVLSDDRYICSYIMAPKAKALPWRSPPPPAPGWYPGANNQQDVIHQWAVLALERMHGLPVDVTLEIYLFVFDR